MVNLIVVCRLFIQLENSFNSWKPWVHIQKISSRYRNHRKGSNSLFWESIFSNPVINKLEYGKANLVPVSKKLFLKMLERLHRLLLEIDLSEPVSKYTSFTALQLPVWIWKRNNEMFFHWNTKIFLQKVLFLLHFGFYQNCISSANLVSEIY